MKGKRIEGFRPIQITVETGHEEVVLAALSGAITDSFLQLVANSIAGQCDIHLTHAKITEVLTELRCCILNAS